VQHIGTFGLEAVLVSTLIKVEITITHVLIIDSRRRVRGGRTAGRFLRKSWRGQHKNYQASKYHFAQGHELLLPFGQWPCV